jgi:hypothetical protein
MCAYAGVNCLIKSGLDSNNSLTSLGTETVHDIKPA